MRSKKLAMYVAMGAMAVSVVGGCSQYNMKAAKNPSKTQETVVMENAKTTKSGGKTQKTEFSFAEVSKLTFYNESSGAGGARGMELKFTKKE